jgi:hypothetical protein
VIDTRRVTYIGAFAFEAVAARTIGPAVAAGVYDGIFVYLAAQVVGAICAGALYRSFWMADTPATEPGPRGERVGDRGRGISNQAPAK